MPSRDEIIAIISNIFNNIENITSAFISGSTAFNRDDNLSDIDIRIISETRHFDNIILNFEALLEQDIGINDSYHPIDSTYEQRFYSLRQCSKFHIIDLVCAEQTDLPLFLDKNRMGGAPLILQDRFSLIRPVDTAQATYSNFIAKITDIKNQFNFLSRILVERAIQRGLYTEAIHFYNTRVVALLIQALRHKYCTSRQDFGLRYLHKDLPDSILSTIDELHKISSFDDLKKNMDIADKLFQSTIASIDL